MRRAEEIVKFLIQYTGKQWVILGRFKDVKISDTTESIGWVEKDEEISEEELAYAKRALWTYPVERLINWKGILKNQSQFIYNHEKFVITHTDTEIYKLNSPIAELKTRIKL